MIQAHKLECNYWPMSRGHLAGSLLASPAGEGGAGGNHSQLALKAKFLELLVKGESEFLSAAKESMDTQTLK